MGPRPPSPPPLGLPRVKQSKAFFTSMAEKLLKRLNKTMDISQFEKDRDKTYFTGEGG